MREGLSQMKTNSLAMDSLGYMWIGTRNGLNRFDGNNIVSYTNEDGLPHDRIHDVLVDKDGQIIALTYRGLSVFDGQSFKNHEFEFLNAEYDLDLDHENKVWIRSHDEIFLFHQDTLTTFQDPVIKDMVVDISWHQTYFISDSHVYIYENGRFEKVAKGKFDHFLNRLHSNDRHLFYERSSKENHIKFCYFKNGEKYCAENSREYYKVNPDIAFFHLDADGTFTGESMSRTLRIEKSEFIRIVDAFMDRTGNFWLADENGFSIIQNSPFTHYPYRDLPYVWTVNQDKNGHYWAGSFGYGLWHSSDGIQFETNQDVRNVTQSPYFLATSVTDEAGNLYLGHGQGIIRWDGQNFDLWLPNKPVYALAYNDKTETLYAGTISNVYSLDMDGQIQSSIEVSSGLHDNEYIQNLSIDNAGRVWAGSYTGLSILDAALDNSQNFIQSAGSLPCAGVFCSYTDKSGMSWLGGDLGLMYFDSKENSIVAIQSDVLNSMVKSITRLDDEHLLIGAKDGLFIFNDQKFRERGSIDFHVFNTSNGYQGLEPGFTGFYEDDEGSIWICSASSVDVLRKEDYTKYKSSLTPRIDRLDGRSLSLDKEHPVINIPRGQSDLQISVDAIGLIRPQTVKYQWKLDDLDWSEWTTEKQIVLNDLDHGQHRFAVRVGPTDLPPQQTEIDEIEFQVDLPFYLRSNFPMIAITTMLILLLLASFLYLRQKIENSRYVKQLAASKFLRSQLLLSELNPHFIFNILSSIQHKVLMGDRDEASSYIVKLSKMIRNFLSASHQSHRNLENYRENDISLEKELELLESYLEFEKMKSDDHFDFDIKFSAEVVPSQVFVPPMLIQPFVENAIKHGVLLSSGKGKVVIEIYYLEEDLMIAIEDDGVGREKAKQIKGDRTGHVSLGTMIIDQRIDLLNQLGYNLEVQTTDVQPQGTRVTIRLKE